MTFFVYKNRVNIFLSIVVGVLFFVAYSIDTAAFSESLEGELCTPTSLTKCWNGCKEGFQNVNGICVECPQTPNWTYWKAGECLVCGSNSQEPCPGNRCRIWTKLDGSTGKCIYCPSWTNSYSEGSCEECGKRGLRTCIARPTGVPGGTAFCKDWEFRAKSTDSTCSACGYENEVPCPRIAYLSTLPSCTEPFSSFTNISDITKCACPEGTFYNSESKECVACGGNTQKSCPVTFTTSWSCKPNTGLEKKTNSTCGCPSWTTWDTATGKCTVCGEKHGQRICESQTEKCKSEFVISSGKCVCAAGEDPSNDLKTCSRCGEYKAKQCKIAIVATGTKCRNNLKEKDIMTGVTGATCSCDKNSAYSSATEKCEACASWKYSDPPFGKETCETCGGNGEIPCPLPSVSGKECNDTLGLAKNTTLGKCMCPGETEYNEDATTPNKCALCGHNNEKACSILFATNSGCKDTLGLKNVSGKCICSGQTIWDTNSGKCVICGQEHYQRACTGKTPECSVQFTSKNNICYCNTGTKPLTTDYKSCVECGTYKGDTCWVSPTNLSICRDTLTPSYWVDGTYYSSQKCMCKDHTALNTDDQKCYACPDWMYSYPSNKKEKCEACGGYNELLCPYERRIDGQYCKINLGLTSTRWDATKSINVCACAAYQIFKNGKCEDCDTGTTYDGAARSCIPCGDWKQLACMVRNAWGYGPTCKTTSLNANAYDLNYRYTCSCNTNKSYSIVDDSDYTFDGSTCSLKNSLFNHISFSTFYGPYSWTGSDGIDRYYSYAYDDNTWYYIWFGYRTSKAGMPQQINNGVIGKALSFANNIPGSAAIQYGEIAYGNNYGPQTTVALWINTSDTSPSSLGSFLGGDGGYANIYSYVAVYGGKFRVFIDGSGWQASNATLNSNTWYHLAFSYDTSTKNWKMYVNGQLEKSGTAANTVTNPNIRYIGAYGPSSAYNFNGSIDEYRFYKQVLTDAQVKEVYDMK